jgi:hypothetical protein
MKVEVKPYVGFYDHDPALPWYLPEPKPNELKKPKPDETTENTQLGILGIF